MVARLIARWCASLTRVAARSSRLQRVAGRSCSSVLLVAKVRTVVRSSGGKLPGPSGTRGVLQSGQTRRHEAFSPQSDGVSIAVQFGGDVQVGGLVVLSSPEDEAAAEGKCLRSGASSYERLELLAVVVGQDDG